MNHRVQNYKTELETAIKGTSQVDSIVGTHKVYHLEIVKEHESILREIAIKIAKELDVPIDDKQLKVIPDNNYDGKIDIQVEVSHKVFKDLSEETKGLRMEFSRRYHDITDIWIPVEVMKVERIILNITIKP